MERPASIRNEAKWIKDCTRIRARASEIARGETTVIEGAIALQRLALSIQDRSDPDLAVFRQLLGNLMGLPISSERKYWAAHALARADVQIEEILEKWQQPAIDAAKRLAERYAWSLEARAALRVAGHSGK